MRNKLYKILAAGFALALAFTLSCSDDKDDGGSGGGLFNVNSQIYNEDGITRYTGSGIIETANQFSYDGDDVLYDWDHIRAGSVAGGIVNLDLAVPADEYLRDFLEDEDQSSCASYPPNIKSAGGTFVLTDNNGNYIGELSAIYSDGQIMEGISYMYFSEAGTIDCSLSNGMIFKINATKGWNVVYVKVSIAERSFQFNTNNILTKENDIKWILELED